MIEKSKMQGNTVLRIAAFGWKKLGEREVIDDQGLSCMVARGGHGVGSARRKATNSKKMKRARVAEDTHAFLDRPLSRDSWAEQRGECFVSSITSGQAQFNDEVVPEEYGGPFLETDGRTEFAHGYDRSNPFDATCEPFPRTSSTAPDD
jgi:hypothetical protein